MLEKLKNWFNKRVITPGVSNIAKARAQEQEAAKQIEVMQEPKKRKPQLINMTNGR